MVRLLYLPRLFVYYNDKEKMTEIDATFPLMEYRLLKYIMNPALIITYFLGIILVYENNYLLAEIFFAIINFSFYSICVSHIFIYSLQRF